MTPTLDVEILLATYNAGRYLPALLDSLLVQTHEYWKLSIRDNGSTDDTLAVIRRYTEQHPTKIELWRDSVRENIGPCQSFARLLSRSTGRYVMFCDGDDVWLPTKIEASLSKLLDVESELGTDLPLLVHTDVSVVDEHLEVISNSFWKYCNLQPQETSLNRLVVRHGTIGNTFIMNRALVELTGDIPRDAIMHDWWIVLVAAVFGHIGMVSAPTLLYRQHGRNDTGAQSFALRDLARKATNVSRLRERIRMKQRQAAAFLNHYREQLSREQQATLTTFANLAQRSFVGRRYALLRHGFFDEGLIRNLGMLAYV